MVEPKHQLLKHSKEAAEPFGAGSCDDPCAAVLSSLRDFGMSQLAPHAALALERARDEGHEREEDLDSSVYAAEEHRLQVRFDDTYPLSAPEVVFLQPTPVHPHVYSNGHICLSTLDCDWSPVMSVESLCVSIHAMLCSCKEQEKKRPDGDLQYVRSVGGRSPKLTRWAFHDDKC